ncbi:MAG: hypothetical protein QOG87_2541 [Actinomycetota bacterium]|jgi:hypothetical protein
MSMPQPPEIATPPEPTGPIPEENLPGHHPEHDQDKPEGPPPKPAVRKRKPKKKGAGPTRVPRREPDPEDGAEVPAKAVGTRRFGFAFERRVAPFAFAFGVTPVTAWAEVDGRELRVRFGPWSARTPLENVMSASITGPYSLPKVAGPAHFSFADGGATFATTTKRGVCLQLREPIPALVPLGLLRHSGLTLTVDDVEGFVAAVTRP